MAIDIAGGAHTDPGDAELDVAIEQIVGDYIPDSLLRVQLAQRILAEVLRRTPISDPYATPPTTDRVARALYDWYRGTPDDEVAADAPSWDTLVAHPDEVYGGQRFGSAAKWWRDAAAAALAALGLRGG